MLNYLGQGVWYTITHYPDRVIAAAPLSAYVSIQSMVDWYLFSNF